MCNRRTITDRSEDQRGIQAERMRPFDTRLGAFLAASHNACVVVFRVQLELVQLFSDVAPLDEEEKSFGATRLVLIFVSRGSLKLLITSFSFLRRRPADQESSLAINTSGSCKLLPCSADCGG